MAEVDEVQDKKGEGSDQEVNEMPWMNYFMPAASTKLITKRCLPYSVYIGFYYVIQLACCICAVNFYGDADRFNSCGLEDAEKNLPQNAMKIYDSVEAQIREAMERGDFDNLPNKGKPLDLSEWEKTPQHLRMTYGILKNAGYSPAEVHTKSELAGLRAMLENETDEEKKARLIKKINALAITDSIQMERLRKE